jgi:hypothetical protein
VVRLAACAFLSMAWRIVRQPNGLYARFSDIVSTFTHMGLARTAAVELCMKESFDEDDFDEEAAQKKVRSADNDLILRVEGVDVVHEVNDGLNRWRECLELIALEYDDVPDDVLKVGNRDRFYRASHLMVCEGCGKLYIQHPNEMDPEYLDCEGRPFLNRICNGDLVKL